MMSNDFRLPLGRAVAVILLLRLVGAVCYGGKSLMAVPRIGLEADN